MRSPRGISGLGVVVVVMLAFSGLGAALAQADIAPRWSLDGVFLMGGEEKVLEGKNTERLLLEVPQKTAVGLEFPNEDCKMEGKIEGSEAGEPGTKKEVTLDCSSVTVYTPTDCVVHGVGQAAGLLKTNKLKSTLVWKNKEFGVVDDLLSAETGGKIAEFEVEGKNCASEAKGKYVIEKELLAELKPTAEEQKAGTVLFPEPALADWWDNKIPRVKHTISKLTVNGTESTVRGTMSYEVNGAKKFGIFGS